MSDRSATDRPLLILIANGHEWSVRSIESILSPNGYATVRAYTGTQALELARHAQPDVLVLERRLADMDAVEVCRRLRSEQIIDDVTPIVVTTDTTASRLDRLEILRAGAWDICTHPLDADVLLAKLNGYAVARAEMRRLRDASLLDGATGLYNVRGLTRRARELGAEAVRRRTALACVVFSAEPADGGPEETAQQLGEQLAMVFERTGRLSDVVGRIGQAEFAVIAPSTEAEGAIRLVQRVEAALAAQATAAADRRPPPRLRVGYAAVSDLSESTLDPVELLLRASAALRDARSSGEYLAQGVQAGLSSAFNASQLH